MIVVVVNFMENYRKRNIIEGSHDNIIQPDSMLFKESADSALTAGYMYGVCAQVTSEFSDILLNYYQEGFIDGLANFIKKVIDFIIKLFKSFIAYMVRLVKGFMDILGKIKDTFVTMLKSFFKKKNSNGSGGGGGGNPPNSSGGARGKLPLPFGRPTEPYEFNIMDRIKKRIPVEKLKEIENDNKAAEKYVEDELSKVMFEDVLTSDDAKIREGVIGTLLKGEHGGKKVAVSNFTLALLKKEQKTTNMIIDTLNEMVANLTVFEVSVEKLATKSEQSENIIKHSKDWESLTINISDKEMRAMKNLYAGMDDAVIDRSGKVNTAFVFNKEDVVYSPGNSAAESMITNNDFSMDADIRSNINTIEAKAKEGIKIVQKIQVNMEKIPMKLNAAGGMSPKLPQNKKATPQSDENMTVYNAIRDRLVVFLNEMKIILGLTSVATEELNVLKENYITLTTNVGKLTITVIIDCLNEE